MDQARLKLYGQVMARSPEAAQTLAAIPPAPPRQAESIEHRTEDMCPLCGHRAPDPGDLRKLAEWEAI